MERTLTNYSDINKISESSRHLKNNPTHAITCDVLMAASINEHVRKNLEASFVALTSPLLNDCMKKLSRKSHLAIP